MHIAPEAVALRLRPFLGDFVVYRTPLCTEVAAMLSDDQAVKRPLNNLASALEKAIFQRLYNALGEEMTVFHPSGVLRRISMAQMEDLADEALGVWLDALPVTDGHHRLIKAYAMETGSLSAMRVLLQQYGAYEAPGEQALMIHLLQTGFPQERTASWLPTLQRRGASAPPESAQPVE